MARSNPPNRIHPIARHGARTGAVSVISLLAGIGFGRATLSAGLNWTDTLYILTPFIVTGLRMLADWLESRKRPREH